MEHRRVLVTGGAGFIGAALANHLAERNDVVVVDDCSLGTTRHLSPAVEVVEASVLDAELPTDVDVVFHLAARSSYEMHEKRPALGARTNVEGFVNVVEQARVDGCETVVYASTSSLYGTHTEPVSEDASVRAATGYEASKLARERYAEYFSTHYGMDVSGLRLFSVYQGAGGTEGHKGEYANVITQFADDVANGRRPTVYGDGTQSRDFVHVEDVVRGMALAADNRLDGVYNLGTGEAHSFNRVVALLNEELGTGVEPNYVENPISNSIYVAHTRADATAFRSATGWVPSIALEEGIERVCAEYRVN